MRGEVKISRQISPPQGFTNPRQRPIFHREGPHNDKSSKFGSCAMMSRIPATVTTPVLMDKEVTDRGNLQTVAILDGRNSPPLSQQSHPLHIREPWHVFEKRRRDPVRASDPDAQIPDVVGKTLLRDRERLEPPAHTTRGEEGCVEEVPLA